MMTDNFCFYLQTRLIQTSQTGGQSYSDTCPFSIPWLRSCIVHIRALRGHHWKGKQDEIMEKIEGSSDGVKLVVFIKTKMSCFV
jgi:hypothetical protein